LRRNQETFMSTKKLAALLSLVLLFIAGSVVRAADVLQSIPDTSLAIVLVNRLEETSDKIEKLTTLVGAPQQSLLTMLRVRTGIHDGLDEKGTAAIALLPAKDGAGMPQAAILLPVTDYKKFLSQLQPDDATKKFAEVRLAGQPVLVCQHGDFAALAAPDAKGALEDLLNSVKDVSADLSPLRTWLGETDAAAVGTPAGIKFAIEQAQFYLPLLRGGAGFGQQPGQPGQPGAAEIVNMLEQGLKTVGSEVTHLAIGVKADESSNVRITSRVRFTPGGDWANAAKGVKAPKEGVLAGLPAEPYGMAFGMTIPPGLREALGNQIVSFLKMNPALTQMPPEQQARLAQATIDMMAPVESMAMSLGVPKPGEPLYSAVVSLFKVDDAAKYLDRYATAITQFNAAFKNPQGPAISYEIKKIDINGAPALDIATDLSALNQPGAPDMKPGFEKMFGPGDKMHTYLAVVDDKTVVIAYVGIDNAKRIVAAAKAAGGGLAADSQIAETAALLPKGAQWQGYLHPKGLLDFAGAAMTLMAPAAKPQMPALATSPPIGMAGKISAAGLNVDIVAPAATLQAIGQAVAKARGL
jgi:hypothetical protein